MPPAGAQPQQAHSQQEGYAPQGGTATELIVTPQQEVLFLFLHPEAPAFLASQAGILDTATVWTTSCLLAYLTGRAKGLSHFCWEGDTGHWLVVTPTTMTVAAGGEAGARQRMNLLGEAAQFEMLGWQDVMTAFADRTISLPEVDLAIRQGHSDASASWRVPALLAAGISLAGFLFVGAEATALLHHRAQESQWQQATNELYAITAQQAGVQLGAQPFTTLLDLVEANQGAPVEHIDLVQLLEVLSRHAPEGIRLLRCSFSGGSGSLTMQSPQLEPVQRLLEAANAELAAMSELSLQLENAEKRRDDFMIAVAMRAGP